MLARGNEFFFSNEKKIKKNKKNSFTRKMFRILTKRILTWLFKKKKKKGGGYSVFWLNIVQKLPKKC